MGVARTKLQTNELSDYNKTELFPSSSYNLNEFCLDKKKFVAIVVVATISSFRLLKASGLPES